MGNAGAILINSVEAIRNTYRNRMIPLLSSTTMLFPKSELIVTATPHWERHLRAFSSNADIRPLWIKRGDVHNTQKGDVTLARSAEEVHALLLAFQSRGVAQVALQEHIEGDLVKLYGIGQSGETWFRWFYHKDQRLKRHPFSEEALRDAFFARPEFWTLRFWRGCRGGFGRFDLPHRHQRLAKLSRFSARKLPRRSPAIFFRRFPTPFHSS